MIYGSYLYNTNTLAKALDRLSIGYTVYGINVNEVRTVVHKHDYNIAIVESVNKAINASKKGYKVIFVCDAKSVLDKTNVDRTLFKHYTKDTDFCKALKQLCKNDAPLTITIKEDSLQEIVDKITTKSILTDIQTLVNKVNPYGLRKNVHKLVISYFYGAIPFKEVTSNLSKSVKLQALYNVMKTDSAKTIRNAVMAYRNTKDEYAVSKEYGVHTFEILYVYNSYSKL